MDIFESSLNQLYQSAVDAFPNTTMRQHATNPIKITNLHWVPYKGMKTLYIRGLAQNEGKEYSPNIVFKQVKYHLDLGVNIITLIDNNDQKYFLEQLSMDDNDVLVRCNCPDFKFRFGYYNHLDKSLQGRKSKKYEGQGLWESNPTHSPGLCKHIMKLMKVLDESGIVA